MLNKKDLTKTNILWSTVAWLVGLTLIFIIWSILSATVYKDNGKLPNVGKCFVAFGQILSSLNSWNAILIAWAQTFACFTGCLIIVISLIIACRFWKRLAYFISPFITLFRSLPTIIIMILIAIFMINVKPLVPITVAFFIIFPNMYEGISNAINQVSKNNIEMATVFKISKWEQFKNIYLPSILPYVFSSMVATFGLTFKIAIASQLVNTMVDPEPGYPSIGVMIQRAMQNGKYDIVIGWGMIAILLSLIMELIIKEIGRICMPNRYRDKEIIKKFFFGKKTNA